MTEREILARVREMILECSQGNSHKWWYANRFVFARLSLDERKTKVDVKRKLVNAGAKCHACGKAFESRRDIHLHRLDGNKAYSDDNCVLMHAECHRKFHSSPRSEEEPHMPETGREPSVTKWSKRYDDKFFNYWWDIAPAWASEMDGLDAFEFAKKDTAERCIVPVDTLKKFLTAERQTTRGQGHWGIKVLKDRPDELAFEPGTGSKDWLFLPVVWIADTED